MFQVGDRVLPISKSEGNELVDSLHWREAQRRKQPFLYVNHKRANGIIACTATSCHGKKQSGDFFLATDLIPYKEADIKNESMLHLLKSSE